VKGLFSGLYLGIIAVPLLLVPGALLCFTGIGAVLGLPMIVAAIVAPLLGTTIGVTHSRETPQASSPTPTA
jgi:hypothetical protein